MARLPSIQSELGHWILRISLRCQTSPELPRNNQGHCWLLPVGWYLHGYVLRHVWMSLSMPWNCGTCPGNQAGVCTSNVPTSATSNVWPQCRLIFQSHGWSGFIYIKLHWSIHDHPCIYGTWTEHPNRTHPNHPKTLSEQSRSSTSLIESWVLARLYSLAQAFAPGRNKGQERVVS